MPGQWLIHVNSPELWVFMQTKYDWIISSRRESLLVELMEEHCSRPDEMCNRVQNIFAVWNIGWKGSPAWVKQGNNLNLRFVFFFVALDVVELCMMVRVMHFFLFYFFLLYPALHSLGKLQRFQLFAFCQRLSKNQTKGKSVTDCFQCFPKTQSSKCKWYRRQNNCRATGTTSCTCLEVQSVFIFIFEFIIFIYHFVYYHFHQFAKLFNKSIKIC